MSYLDLFGLFSVAWVVGFAAGFKFVVFKKALEVSS